MNYINYQQKYDEDKISLEELYTLEFKPRSNKTKKIEKEWRFNKKTHTASITLTSADYDEFKRIIQTTNDDVDECYRSCPHEASLIQANECNEGLRDRIKELKNGDFLQEQVDMYSEKVKECHELREENAKLKDLIRRANFYIYPDNEHNVTVCECWKCGVLREIDTLRPETKEGL